MTINYAQRERAAMCDLFEEVGPQASTLCDGWDAADLAAHIVVRERRPDAAPGILIPPLAGYSEKVRRDYAARPWTELVDLVRGGPPAVSIFGIPGVDRLANTMEFFIHHEDVRRPHGLGPRDLDPGLRAQLWQILKRMSKMMMRRAPAGIHLDAGGGRVVIANSASPVVTVSGDVGELALFSYGRQDAAEVDLQGPDDAVEKVANAAFGI